MKYKFVNEDATATLYEGEFSSDCITDKHEDTLIVLGDSNQSYRIIDVCNCIPTICSACDQDVCDNCPDVGCFVTLKYDGIIKRVKKEL